MFLARLQNFHPLLLVLSRSKNLFLDIILFLDLIAGFVYLWDKLHDSDVLPFGVFVFL
jgi:hypothetical protein